MFDVTNESECIQLRLKSLSFAQDDVELYGPVKRSNEELAARATSHLETFLEQRPLSQTLVDFVCRQYAIAYLTLLVAHTGLKAPFTLETNQKYTTSLYSEGSEDELSFFGLQGLLSLIATEQKRRKGAEETEGVEDLQLTVVQVSIYDRDESHLEWHKQSVRFVAYDVRGNDLLGVLEKSPGIDEILQGLGLPFLYTDAALVRRG